MSILTREAIFAAQDLRTQVIHIPEWDGDVRIRSLNFSDCAHLREVTEKTPELFAASLVAISVVDEQGGNLFTTDDVPMLNRKNMRAVTRIAEAAAILNALAVDAGATPPAPS